MPKTEKKKNKLPRNTFLISLFIHSIESNVIISFKHAKKGVTRQGYGPLTFRGDNATKGPP
jgi:hypothetical protein